MRIVIDARESGTSTGRYIDKLVENLHELRPKHEFVVLTKSHRVSFMKNIAPSFRVVESAYKEFSLGEQLGLKKQIKSLKPDLVHFGMVQQPVLYRGRVVTTMHDLTTVRFKNPSKNQTVFFLKQVVYKWLNKRVAKKSRYVITPTEYVRKDVAQYAHVDPRKIIVTPESADKISEAAKSVPGLTGKRFIMYVGRSTPHKNLGRLIEAFGRLQKDMPELHLVLAGKKDTNYGNYEKKVTEMKLKNVIFTGFITDGQLRWLYEHTACYVFPSLSEGFGLPGLEAMVHGAPVASSNYTCLPEVYGDGAVYFNPMDIASIGETIASVLNDRKLREKLIDLGHKQIKNYSWSRMAKQTVEVYERALLLN